MRCDGNRQSRLSPDSAFSVWTPWWVILGETGLVVIIIWGGAYLTISWGLFFWQRGKTVPPSERWAKDLSFSSVSEVLWSVLAWASLSSPGRGGGEGIKFKSFL